ncbi:MAG: Rhomboid family protein [Chthonomonadales bacterium]|nr:Rhomboid family protein [Chthonomonadales bacterium]
MPDDYDYSQPVKRNTIVKGPIPFQTMALITFCAVFTSFYWIAPHNDTVNPLSNFISAILPTPDQIWDRHYLGLFTSFFVHIDIIHILFNMMWLWKLGSVLEVTIPPWQYLLFILLATVVGSCCELFISGQTGAGASGTIYALMGLMWAGGGFHESWRQVATRDNMRYFMIWGVLCIFLTVSHTLNVGNGAHFGGLLFGLAVGYLFYAPRRRLVWIPVLVGMVTVCIMSLAWMPWSSQWNDYKGTQADERHRYTEALAYYERGLRVGGESYWFLDRIALTWMEIAEEAHRSNRKEEADAALKKAGEALEASTKAIPAPEESEGAADTPQERYQNTLKNRLEQDLHPHP